MPKVLLQRPPMPTSFFDLPRELRDIIYELVLISPNKHITPILLTQFLKTRRQCRFALQIPLLPSTSAVQCNASSEKWPLESSLLQNCLLSLSLPRTCRQIRTETQLIFWEQNVFDFHTPQMLISTLKDMGQIPSRLIRSITLPISLTTTKQLPKALRLLASRSRLGDFQSLTLTIGRNDMIAIETCKMSRQTDKVAAYDGLLEVLRDGGKEKGFKKSMGVESLLKNWRVGGGVDHSTVRELHLAWGGEMRVNGELEWKDYVYAGKCAGFS